jgi:hypothetical protein
MPRPIFRRDLPHRGVSTGRKLVYPPTVTPRMKRRSALALLLLATPLAAVAAVAYLTFGTHDRPSLAIAAGAAGGAFHPVAGSFVADETEVDSCTGDADYACLQQAFGNVAFKQGAKRALSLFDTQMKTDTRVRADCHRIAHVIGSAAYARYDNNVARTFAVGSSTCASGYYHGILERAFVGVTTKAKLVEVARSLCVASAIRPRSFLDYQCQHGLGHGLMIQTGYDLPIALATCAELRTRWDEVVCTGGAFMENVTTRFGFRSPWLDDEDPLYPCPGIERRHRQSCYLRAPVRVLEYHGSDFAKSAATCAALDRASATACFRGLGREAVSIARYSAGKIISLCRSAGTHAGECLLGAARTVGDGSGLPGAERSARMCETAPRGTRSSCFSGVGIIVGLLYPTHASRRAACAKLSGTHAGDCTSAAISEVDADGRGAWG